MPIIKEILVIHAYLWLICRMISLRIVVLWCSVRLYILVCLKSTFFADMNIFFVEYWNCYELLLFRFFVGLSLTVCLVLLVLVIDGTWSCKIWDSEVAFCICKWALCTFRHISWFEFFIFFINKILLYFNFCGRVKSVSDYSVCSSFCFTSM